MSRLTSPLVDPFRARIGYHLRRASVAMMADLSRALQPLQLSVTEASLLIMMAANPGATQSTIGRELAIASANMAPLVGRLAKRGLIGRTPMDGRSHSLRLTECGVRLASEAERVTEQQERTFFFADPDPHDLGPRLSRLWRDSPSSESRDPQSADFHDGAQPIQPVDRRAFSSQVDTGSLKENA